MAAFVRFHSTKLFKRLDILDGESGWEQKKRQRQREGAADIEEEKKEVGIMARTLEGLLTGALMQQPSFCKV